MAAFSFALIRKATNMKKFLATISATLVACCLMVAPAFADTSYNYTEVNSIEDLIPIPSYMDDTAPITEFITPDAPGDYEFHIYAEEKDAINGLPKTNDHFGDFGSFIAIIAAVCLGLIFLSTCYKLDTKKE